MRQVQWFWFLPAIFLFFLPAHVRAQDQPQPSASSASATQTEESQGPAEWELFGGYSYLRSNLNGPGSSFDLNGGSGSITENINNWFGGRFEFNAWGGTLAGVNITAQTYTYGPVFSYRRFGHSTLFGHAQFGAMHVSSGYLAVSESDTQFAMTVGGGMDFKLNRRAAIRVQGDYLISNFLNARQDNVQLTTGLVIYLGKRRTSPWRD
jgi:opacity protein-like surface antigen